MNTPQQSILKFHRVLQGLERICNGAKRGHVVQFHIPSANYSKIKMQFHSGDGAWATAIILTPHHFHCPIHSQLWVIKTSFFAAGKHSRLRQAAGQQHQDVATLTDLGTLVIQSVENGRKEKATKFQFWHYWISWHYHFKWLQIVVLASAEKSAEGTSATWNIGR